MGDTLKKLGGFSLGPILCAVLGFVLIPTITYFISPDEYGRASMFSLAVSILQMVVYLGLDQAYIKRYYESEDKTKLLANVMLPPILLVVIISVGIFLFRERISYWLFDTYDEMGCVTALIFMPATLVIEQFAITEVRMKQKGLEYSILTVLVKLLVLTATVTLLLVYERSFRAVVWGTASAQIVFAIILLVTGRAKIIISPKYYDKELMLSLLKYGLPIIPAMLIGWILGGMDRVMLRTMSGYATLGVYDVASKVSNILAVAQSCFAAFWVPTAHKWNNDGGDIHRFDSVGRYICLLMSAVFMGVLLFKELIFMIFKSTYVEATYILPFLLIYPIMYTASEVPVMGIYFKERTKSTLMVSCISAAVNLLLNYILIPIMGAQGAAIATGMSYIVFFWCRALLSRKIWYTFRLDGYVFTTAVVVLAAAVNTLVRSTAVYAFNIALIAAVAVFFKNEIRFAIGVLKKLVNRKRGE